MVNGIIDILKNIKYFHGLNYDQLKFDKLLYGR